MAGSYAGAYGAGAASDELHRLLAERLTNQKFEEEKRSTRSREEADAADRRQRDTFAKQEADARAAREEASKQENYEDRVERSRQFNSQMQTHTDDRQVRVAERADDRETGLEGEDRTRQFQREENKKNRDTQLQVVRESRANRGSGPERTVRVSYTDENGQNVEEYMTADEARAHGKFRPATKGAPGMKEKLADLFETERVAKGILDRGAKMKWRGVGPLAGRITSIGNDIMGNDPGVAALHAEIGNVFSIISNQRFGAALTPGELSRATQFLPQKTDPPPVLQQKLQGLIEFAESKRQNMGGLPMQDSQPGMGQPAGGGSAIAPGTKRIISGQPATWDGQGWLPDSPMAQGPPPGAELLVR